MNRGRTVIPPESTVRTVHQLQSVTPSSAVISIAQVRPGPRAQNEYIDTPKHHVAGLNKSGTLVPVGTTSAQTFSTDQQRTLTSTLPRNIRNPAISQQPVSISPPLKKEVLNVEEDTHTGPESIICSRCGKCKCYACTEPKDLPSSWLCNRKYHLSAENVVEYCTCVSCVKCVFYHCSKDQDTDECISSQPCACCERPHCCKRWLCIGLMSLCLPCMCFYFPAKCLIKGCTFCYNKCNKKGCQCSTKRKLNSHSQTKRLIESDSSSG